MNGLIYGLLITAGRVVTRNLCQTSIKIPHLRQPWSRNRARRGSAELAIKFEESTALLRLVLCLPVLSDWSLIRRASHGSTESGGSQIHAALFGGGGNSLGLPK